MPTGSMPLTEYLREVHANRTLPAGTAATVRAMLRDPLIIELLREIRATTYHVVAIRPGHEPTTAGPHTSFADATDECEAMLRGGWGEGESLLKFEPFERVAVIDAYGAVVWTKERG